MTLLSVVMALSTGLIIRALDQNSNAGQQSVAQQRNNAGMEQLTRALREAIYRLALVRRAQETGIDDTTSMLFRFSSGATAYLGTVIATAETWRLQVFGSRGWAEVGGIGHLDTWQLRYSLVNEADPFAEGKVETLTFAPVSTERAELEHFADAALARRPLAAAGGDEIHGVAVLEAIVDSANRASTVRIEP